MSDGSPGLASILNSLTAGTQRRGPKCSIVMALDRLADTDPPARDALLSVVDRGDVPAAAIARALTQAGMDVKAHTVRRHRRRADGSGCCCPAGS